MPREIDRFVDTKRTRDEQLRQEVSLLDLAKSVTPQMFSDLAKQLDADLKKLLAAGEIVKVEMETDPRLDGYFTAILDGRYPTFFLRLEPDGGRQPIIHVTQSSQASPHGSSTPKHSQIEIIAKGQGQYFYRIGGNDEIRERAADVLIAPLLSVLR
jgi:hypothetical protein